MAKRSARDGLHFLYCHSTNPHARSWSRQLAQNLFLRSLDD
ncbi:hypothetical protein [Brunnivagina elsteri]|nr:hypothetical protein [Calothrix elsteri]